MADGQLFRWWTAAHRRVHSIRARYDRLRDTLLQHVNRGRRLGGPEREGEVAVSAHDIARELRSRLPGHTGVAKIQKLLYYCQGWHLAHYGEPMFHERIEAWRDGPVVAKVWADEQHDRQVPAPSAVSASHLDIVEYVIARYGSESGRLLIDRTHAEQPWKSIADANGGTPPVPSPVIDDEKLREFFVGDSAYRNERDQHEQVIVLGPVSAGELAREQAAALERGEHVQLA